jgi:hypothetical protein
MRRNLLLFRITAGTRHLLCTAKANMHAVAFCGAELRQLKSATQVKFNSSSAAGLINSYLIL